MSILIKGMEMPSVCDDCWALGEYGDYPVCQITEEQRGYNFRTREKRMDKCPLIEVPAPHGRLIDADELANDLDYDVELAQRTLDDMDFVGVERDHVQFEKDCKQNCMWYISESPTVIEAEK